jgi:hypothetical protein
MILFSCFDVDYALVFEEGVESRRVEWRGLCGVMRASFRLSLLLPHPCLD